MVQDDPAKRPTIGQVANCFADIRKKLGTLKFRARVSPRDVGTRFWAPLHNYQTYFQRDRSCTQGNDG